jgi:hypothetical protein
VLNGKPKSVRCAEAIDTCAGEFDPRKIIRL